ncbi:MAG TPA: type I DNA topoisomerase [Pirellulales bacterium]|nr:type I DNA topoisomerase [Pirellulales bacterium]
MAKRTTKSSGNTRQSPAKAAAAPRAASAKGGGKSLVIVESPAKARTISGFLGRDFVIEASIGHVRDLPQGAKQIPAQYKKEDWAYLGVNVHDNFSPVYIVPPGKTEQVRKLRSLVKDAKELYLATDEDREGEAISWHLLELLKPKVPVRRLVFHEITKEAIEDALANPRQIDDALVRAQETRRILDRLYGYEVSPLLWRKVRPKLSAGRVQSVAVRLIVERERQRMAFVAATYWDLLGRFAKQAGQELEAGLVSYQGRAIPATKDFDSATGKVKDPTLLLLDEQQVNDLADRLRQASFSVTSVETTPYTSKPYPPFTTSTLQQEANRKLGFTARRTMQAAQSLYENGYITYMRTDSTNLAKVAIDAARELVQTQYGGEYLPGQPRTYVTKVKNAQEAHEAIRPAGHPFSMPESLRTQLSSDEFRLYDLIWKRTVASQMADARGRRIMVTIEGGEAVFKVGGKTIDFAGYLRAYVEGSDDPEAELADRETVLPSVEVGEKLNCRELESKSHTTQPPSRFNEATLTRALEEMGIGRPSTYAAIIDTILARDYVFKRGNALVPTWTAFAVAHLLERHLPKLVDYQFTAQMEDDLDAISRGETKWVDYLHSFYFGNGREGLKKQLEHKVEAIDARDVSRVLIGKPDGADPIHVRVGRFGPFLEQGERRASIPDGFPPDELTIDKALEMLGQAEQAEEPLGICPDTHKAVYLKVGRFGPYVQRGSPDDEEKPRNASLLKGMRPEDVTFEVALKLLSLPRDLGPHPEGSPLAGEAVVVNNGRFGPYVKCGAETRSLPAGVSPLEVTMAEALRLLAEPKKARRGFGAPREPLRSLGESPVTKQAIQLFEGRYGLYVTDGTTNASLPKGVAAEELTPAQALELLAERAARGPAKRPTRRAAAGRRTAATNGEPAAKKPAKKKAAPRKKGGKAS